MPQNLPEFPGFHVESDETVWKGRFPLQVVKFRNRTFAGGQSGLRTWELWRRGQAAALLPYDPVADSVVLIEQFRLPALAAGLDPIMVELPAGLCDSNEEPAVTVRRETEEEIGLAATRIETISDVLLSPGGCDEHVFLYVGQITAPACAPDGLVEGHYGLTAEDEDIRVRVWPAQRAIDAALGGRFHNAITTLALFWLAARRTALRDRWTAGA